MACNKPLKGWFSVSGGFTLSAKDAYRSMPMSVPCGQCMGCRLAKTAEWATRIMHEAQMHDISSFVTLTYNNENLPIDLSLDKTHLQLFLKRLRKYLSPKKIRFFAAGEYGDISLRPHYHLIIFNYWPQDKELYKETEYGNLWTSVKLEKLWGKGFVTIGDVTFETAAYTASYVTKKITGDEMRFHYRGRNPEFALMSRNKGIGATWFDKFELQTKKLDSVVSRGFQRAVPQYYQKKLKERDFDTHFMNKIRRIGKRLSEERLDINEIYLRKKQEFFKKDSINT